MAIGSKQIGWSNESNLLWEISDKLNDIISSLGPTPVSYYYSGSVCGNPLFGQVIRSFVPLSIYDVVLANDGNCYVINGIYVGPDYTVEYVSTETCFVEPCQTTTSTTTAIPNLTLTVAPNTNFDIPAYTGADPIDSNFTIEWFAKMTSDDNHPRAWSIGSFPDAAHAVSIDNGVLSYWVGGVNIRTTTLSPGYIGNWTYFSIMRRDDTIYFYQDGVQLNSTVFTDAIPSNGLPLYLGSEGNDSLQNGLMSNFRWNSESVHPPAPVIPIPTAPLSSIFGTKLLIFQGETLPLEITDNSGMLSPGDKVNGTGVYNADNPFIGYQGSIQFGTI